MATTPRPFTPEEMAERSRPYTEAEEQRYLAQLPGRMRQMGFTESTIGYVTASITQAAADARAKGRPLSYAALEQGARLLANTPAQLVGPPGPSRLMLVTPSDVEAV